MSTDMQGFRRELREAGVALGQREGMTEPQSLGDAIREYALAVTEVRANAIIHGNDPGAWVVSPSTRRLMDKAKAADLAGATLEFNDGTTRRIRPEPVRRSSWLCHLGAM